MVVKMVLKLRRWMFWLVWFACMAGLYLLRYNDETSWGDPPVTAAIIGMCLAWTAAFAEGFWAWLRAKRRKLAMGENESSRLTRLASGLAWVAIFFMIAALFVLAISFYLHLALTG
jgi:hypothetical protein